MDAELAEDLSADRLDASGLLRVQVDGLARVEPLHQRHTGEPEQQQQQREAGGPHCPVRRRGTEEQIQLKQFKSLWWTVTKAERRHQKLRNMRVK